MNKYNPLIQSVTVTPSGTTYNTSGSQTLVLIIAGATGAAAFLLILMLTIAVVCALVKHKLQGKLI